jgi:MFS transporter, OFA family, oxalate/formate antiporter
LRGEVFEGVAGQRSTILGNRWFQLVAMVVAMMAIANLQFAWTLFTKPLQLHYHVSLAAVQVAFSAFILTETWLVPVEGYLIDRLGPKLVLGVGGVLVGLGWIGPALWAPNVAAVIAWYALGGVGAGAVYGGCVGTAIKWFPDHRGLCTGLVAAGYGVGTALTAIPIAGLIKSSGYQQAFLLWGIIQGAVIVLTALVISHPAPGWTPAGWAEKQARLARVVRMSNREVAPPAMVRKNSFWALYVMMMLMAFTGLVLPADLAAIADTYKVSDVHVAFGLTAIVLAIEVDRILNGVSRPVWGWISDRIGRENAMFASFLIQAVLIVAWIGLLRNPLWFVIMSGLVYFTWANIYSLFPAAVGDLYGPRYATTNYGLLYTSKGVASLFAGPVTALIATQFGRGWLPIFFVMAGCALAAAAMDLLWLKPAVRRATSGGEDTPAAKKVAPAQAGATRREAPTYLASLAWTSWIRPLAPSTPCLTRVVASAVTWRPVSRARSCLSLRNESARRRRRSPLSGSRK